MAILTALGFRLHRQGRGDHEIWMRRVEGRAYLVTVDKGERQFDDYIIRSMIKQAGVIRETFYCATPATAQKIGKQGRGSGDQYLGAGLLAIARRLLSPVAADVSVGREIAMLML